MSSRVIHFELPVDDFRRACDFYRNVFGWEITAYPGEAEYYLVKTGERSEPGIDGGLTARSAAPHTVNTIGVANLDQAIASVEANGGQVVAPRMEIPEVGWLAYVQDTEGNMFGMMQSMMANTM